MCSKIYGSGRTPESLIVLPYFISFVLADLFLNDSLLFHNQIDHFYHTPHLPHHTCHYFMLVITRWLHVFWLIVDLYFTDFSIYLDAAAKSS